MKTFTKILGVALVAIMLAALHSAESVAQSKAPETGAGITITGSDLTLTGDVTVGDDVVVADDIEQAAGGSHCFNGATCTDSITSGASWMTIAARRNNLLIYDLGSGGSMAPNSDNASNLGSTGLRWANIYSFDGRFYDDLVVDDDLSADSLTLSAASYIKMGSYYLSNSESARWYLGSAAGVGDSRLYIGDAYLASSAPQLASTATNATFGIYSSTADATTSSTVGAITLKSSADITATDLILDVQDSAGAHAFTVTEAGAATALSTITSSAGSNSVALQTTLGAYIALSASNLVRSNPSTGGVEIQAASGAYLFPYADNTIDLGKSGSTWKDVWLSGDIRGDASTRGTCTLDGASPSKCTATVTASAVCTCTPVGTTAAIAAGGCAVSLSSTTLTLTSANGLTNNVNYHCIL